MANDTSGFKINFGFVAFPYSVEEALVESASYRPDFRVIQTKRNIAGLKEYFKKHVPASPAKKDENEDGTVTALLKLLLESKVDSEKENETAQRNVK